MSFNLNAEADLYGHHKVPKDPDPSDPLTVHFSGYPVPPDSDRTVAQLEDYYVHGRVGSGDSPPPDPERAAYLGEPISGDQTARWAEWRRTGRFPQQGDSPKVKPLGALF